MITITLTDQEALDYLTRRDDLTSRDRLQAQKPPIATSRVTPGLSPLTLERMKRIAEEQPATYIQEPPIANTAKPEACSNTTEGKAWANWEIHVLKDSIASDSKVVRHLKYIYKHLPCRSTAAIRSKLNTLGARIKKGYIV